jgi:DNA-directed RNA polymerase specialized sigma24 family protein
VVWREALPSGAAFVIAVTGDDCEGELMNERDMLAERFSAERTRLRAVAYRMLGSLAEAEDAVQEAWLRLARSDEAAIDNLSGWLTTVVGRVCLDMLRARTARRKDADGRLPDPVVTYGDDSDPEAEAMLADSVGLAPVKVIATRNPAEPDADWQATGGLLPGLGAHRAGPTFETWLDQQ